MLTKPTNQQSKHLKWSSPFSYRKAVPLIISFLLCQKMLNPNIQSYRFCSFSCCWPKGFNINCSWMYCPGTSLSLYSNIPSKRMRSIVAIIFSSIYVLFTWLNILISFAGKVNNVEHGHHYKKTSLCFYSSTLCRRT